MPKAIIKYRKIVSSAKTNGFGATRTFGLDNALAEIVLRIKLQDAGKVVTRIHVGPDNINLYGP